MIYQDSHEKGEITKLVKKTCQEVKTEGLNAGDYIVDDYLIERKRWSELAGRLSTNENDLFLQLVAVKTAAEEEGLTPVLLLEGDMDRGLAETRMNLKYIFSALAGIFQMGIYFFITPEREYTARWLADLEKDSTSSKPRAIRNTPKVPKEEWDRYIVEGFQGIGPSTATGLLEEFGTVQSIMTAEIEDLKQVDGVGTKTAEKIYYTSRGEMDKI